MRHSLCRARALLAEETTYVKLVCNAKDGAGLSLNQRKRRRDVAGSALARQDIATHYCVDLAANLFVAAGVVDNLAIIGQAAWRHQLDIAAQLGDVPNRFFNFPRQRIGARTVGFDLERHLVIGHFT